MKMWSGRFQNDVDKEADAFNASLPFDKRLYKHDIMGSIAHCTMLGEQGIIDKADADTICAALKGISDDIESGKLAVVNAEDIHMFVEEKLTERVGKIGKKLHTARSRNDQVTLDLRLYMRDSIDEIVTQLKTLIETLLTLAEAHIDTIIPAYTHMQKAQPTCLAHHFMAYVEMLLRDIDRFIDTRKRVNVMPLGSGACAGTTFPINRKRVAELLDFADITHNSLDGVSDRDYCIEYLTDIATVMMHLSRFNEEIIYWATDEFGYIGLDDRFSTGSSIMPQKKNPDMSELIRGKTGRCYGNLMQILTVMKGLPLAYNKDMQEDKEAIFDSEDTVKSCLSIFNAMLPTFKFDTDALHEGAQGGFTAATDCADYLVRKGLPFRDAHAVIGGLVLYCTQNGKTLTTLSLDEFKRHSPLFESDILSCVKVENVVQARQTIGGPSATAIRAEIKRVLLLLKKVTSFEKEATSNYR